MKSSNMSNWTTIKSLIWPRKIIVASLALVSVFSGLLEAAFLLLAAKSALTIADNHKTVDLVGDIDLSLNETIIVAIIIIAVRLLIELITVSVSSQLTKDVTVTTRQRLTRAFLDASWKQKSKEPSGQLQHLLINFTLQGSLLMQAINYGLISLASLLALLTAALTIDPIATLVIIGALLILAGILTPLRKELHSRAEKAAKKEAADKVKAAKKAAKKAVADKLKAEKKAAKELEKAVKLAEKEASKELEKAAKKEAAEKLKAEKKAAKELEKATKLAEKKAAKEVVKAAKKAAADKLKAEKKAAKEVEKAEKLAAVKAKIAVIEAPQLEEEDENLVLGELKIEDDEVAVEQAMPFNVTTGKCFKGEDAEYFAMCDETSFPEPKPDEEGDICLFNAEGEMVATYEDGTVVPLDDEE